MNQETPEVTAARIEAERAKARMIDRAHDLQARLNPKTLAQNAWDDARDKGTALADSAVGAVRERPLAATGIAAAVAVFLARKPLKRLAGKMMNSKSPDGMVTVRESELARMETADGYYTAELVAADPIRNVGQY